MLFDVMVSPMVWGHQYHRCRRCYGDAFACVFSWDHAFYIGFGQACGVYRCHYLFVQNDSNIITLTSMVHSKQDASLTIYNYCCGFYVWYIWRYNVINIQHNEVWHDMQIILRVTWDTGEWIIYLHMCWPPINTECWSLLCCQRLGRIDYTCGFNIFYSYNTDFCQNVAGCINL